MSEYEEGIKLLEEKFGGGKDNLIAVATIAREPNSDGKHRLGARSKKCGNQAEAPQDV